MSIQFSLPFSRIKLLTLAIIVILIFLSVRQEPKKHLSTQVAFANNTDAVHPDRAKAGLLKVTENSQNLELIWQMGAGWWTTVVAVQGNYVYMGQGSLLVIVDISTPTDPQEVSSLWMPDPVTDIVVKGEYIYVAAYKTGLRIVDVSDPAHPVEIGSYEMLIWWYAAKLEISGNYVYLVDRHDGSLASIQVLDISDPVHPIMVSLYSPRSANQTEGIQDIVIVGNYAYVLTEQYLDDSALHIVDVSQPTNPTEIGAHQVSGGVNRITVSGNYAYIGGDKLWIVDISDPSNPAEINYQISGHINDLVASSNLLYVLEYNSSGNNLHIFNISNPVYPISLSITDTDGAGREMAVANGYAYLASNYNGLRLVDISDPIAPGPSLSYDTARGVTHISIDGDYAYAVTEDGFWVVDFSDPTDPVEVSLNDIVHFGPFINTLELVENYAYLQAGEDLQVLYISDPVSPTEISLYHTTTGPTFGAAIVGDYVYLSKGNGLQILDISDPVNPLEAGFYASSNGFGQMVVSGNYAYACEDGGLSILDISDPTSPIKVGFYEPSLSILEEIAVGDGYAYVIDWYGTLHVLDISNKANPIEVGNYEIVVYGILASIEDIVIDGPYLYVGAGSVLQVLNISNPFHPTEAGFYELPTSYQSIAVADGRIYIGNYGGGGLMAFRFLSNNTISGQVYHSNQLPFSGANISTNTNLGEITDASGTYAFTGLPSGLYTITPSLADYVFWPPIQNVAVPPNPYHQNFTILPPPISVTLTPSSSNSLVFTDTQGLPTRLNFPMGAVTQTTTLVLTPTIATKAQSAFTGHALKLMAYQEGLALSNFTFGVPVTITFAYSEADVRLVSDESVLTLWQRSEGEWLDAAQTCEPFSTYNRDLEGNILSVSICSTSYFALFGQTNHIYLSFIDNED